MVDPCHCTFVQAHRIHDTQSDPEVNCGLWVRIMCPVGSATVANVPLWQGVLAMGWLLYVWGPGVSGKSL